MKPSTHVHKALSLLPGMDAKTHGRIAVVLMAAIMLPGLQHAAHATDLLEAWQAAQSHDTGLAVAKAEHVAGRTRADQADSLWRPSLEIHAAIGKAGHTSDTRGARFAAPGFGAADQAEFHNSIRHGTQSEYGIQLRQPLLDLGRDAQAGSLRHAAAMAEAAWDGARQNAALRLARQYFEVLMADKQLQVLETQHRATALLLDQAQARFRAGDSAILDTHEAQARLSHIEAGIRQAQTRRAIAGTAFRDISGIADASLARLKPDTRLLLAPPDKSLDEWLNRVDETSPEIRQTIEAAAMAEQQAMGLRAIAQPTLDLLGSAGRSYISGHGSYGHASQNANQWFVGLELRIPLYTGGMRDARYREALAMRDGARLRSSSTRQQIRLMAEAAWLSLDSAPGRIRALEQALKSGTARRDATLLGLEAGDRTALDLLDAEQELAQIRLTLHQALVDLALDRLQLDALAGRLDQASLEYINRSLEDRPILP